ncbi:hypothetical protein [Salinibacter ruber]|uniref:Uncharacterized protein n=1 Tax=Salinibacter ruber TaxID=146919 RepID=A0A9X2V7Y6_9BACT|nr:hypothetical protein [Salinibacter ruber]MCS4121624.1 hypothetical protein [Salinibacter ruber]
MDLLIAPALPLILATGLVILARPYTGLLLVILLQVLIAPSTPGVNPGEIAFLSATIFTFTSWFFKSLILKGKSFRVYGSETPLIVFLSVVLFNLAYSISSGVGASKAILDAAPFAMVSLAFVVKHEVTTEKRVKMLLFFFLTASTIIVLQCLVISVGNGTPLSNPLIGNPNSPFNSSVYLFATPVAISGLTLSRKVHEKGLMFGIVVLHAWRSLVGFRRQPIVLFLIMALVVPYMVRRIRHPEAARLLSVRKIVSIGLVVTAMGAISVSLGGNPIEEYANRLRPEYIMRGLGSRIGTNLIAFNHFMENPLLGKGFGFDTNLTTLVSQVGLDASKDYFEVSVSEVHSLYFYALMHTGLLGFGAGLYLFFRVARDSLHTRITTPLYRYTHQWVAGGAGICLTILLLGVLSIKSFSLEAWMAFGISLGILLRVRKIAPFTQGVHQ